MEKEKKPIYKKWWFWGLVIIVIIMIASMGENNTPSSKTSLSSENTTPTSTETSKTEEISNENKKYNVGEIYEDKSIAIKYVSLDDNYTGYNKYAEVKSDCKIIRAEFEFENVGSSDFLASSYSFNCYADGYDCEAFWSVDDSTFSSTLSAGKKTKGAVYFEVPENSSEITLEYETNAWTNNKVEFIVK